MYRKPSSSWSKVSHTASSYRSPSLRSMYLVLLVDAAHECGSRRQHLINEDEDGLLWGELDALADNVYELADREVGWH